jgi:apolipoprotein N-acyltransferase
VSRLAAAGAFASGALLALSFPKFGHWALAWVALAPLLLASRLDAARAFRLGWTAGFVAGVGLLYWTALVVAQYGGLSLPVGVVLMLLLAAAVALFPALFAWSVARWRAAWGDAALLAAPVAWVATEVLRAYTFFRFPWCLLGYSQQPNLPVIQIARVTAVYGVSFLVASGSAVLAYVLVETRPGPRLRAGAALAGALGLSVAYGAWNLGRAPVETGRVRAALVQASIPQHEKWDPGRAWDNVSQHVRLTREAVGRGAGFVVWPESAVPWRYDEEPAVAAVLGDVARTTRAHLLLGNDDAEPGDGGRPRIFVGAKLLTPSGEVAYRYHKLRLVPFGEYTPLAPLLTAGGRFAARLVQAVGDFAPGREARVGSLPQGRFGTLICYEAIFPDLVRQFTAGGAGMLVNVTNDAWYGRTSAPHQHFAMAAFRAVENGRYLLRAANTGISGVVDPHGRVLEPTPLFERTLVVRDVPFVAGDTFYARHGDVFGFACLGLAAALTLAALARTLATKATRPPSS